jgi:hypothetical protein
MDYEKLCNEILMIDPKIRYAGICDETGETKYGGQREGVKNLLSSDEIKKSNLQALARWALRNLLSSKVGKGIYAMAKYEKVKRITMPLEYNGHLLLITTEVDANQDRIIDHVLKLIQHLSDNYVSDA